MTHLSVNVNKLATLRNARGKNAPDLNLWARRILGFGAFGITVHPRPDQRHVRFDDVRALRDLVRAPAEFNVEGYPSDDFLALVAETKPDQVTLVPDPPDAITSDAGWDLELREDFLKRVLAELKSTRVSLFVDPRAFTRHQEKALARLRPQRVELYTEAYAEAHGTPLASEVLATFAECARRITALGIELNAGHDLNLTNVGDLVAAIPEIKEVSIGHALVCEALERGMESTVRAYLEILGG